MPPTRRIRGVSAGSVAETTAGFEAAPASARQARQFLRDFLACACREDLSDPAELPLSELVTNAILHAHTEVEVTVTLSLTDAGLLVEVGEEVLSCRSSATTRWRRPQDGAWAWWRL